MYFMTIYIPDIATARRFVDVMERYPDIQISRLTHTPLWEYLALTLTGSLRFRQQIICRPS